MLHIFMRSCGVQIQYYPAVMCAPVLNTCIF